MRGRSSALKLVTRRPLLLLMATLLCGGRAEAQWGGFFDVNGALQNAPGVVRHGLQEPDVYFETATYEGTMATSRGALADAWAGVLRGNVGVALGVTVLNARGTTAVSGQVPSPLFTNRHRTASLPERPGLKHQQVGMHLPLLYVFPVTERIHVTVSAGPSWFRLRHDALAAVTRAAEVAPYDSAQLSDFTTTVAEGTAFGYNGAVDVAYLLTRYFGFGLYLRYTGGSVELPFPDGAKPVDVGGAQAGLGLRFRF